MKKSQVIVWGIIALVVFTATMILERLTMFEYTVLTFLFIIVFLILDICFRKSDEK